MQFLCQAAFNYVKPLTQGLEIILMFVILILVFNNASFLLVLLQGQIQRASYALQLSSGQIKYLSIMLELDND